MIKMVLLGAMVIFMLGVVLNMAQSSEAGKDGPQIAHMVYFSLKDNSPKACQELVDACKKYLTKHDGEVYFAAGTLAKDFKREVNDQDFDVSLHIVFENRAAHDKYQDHPRHNDFIKEMKGNWKKVRVFDSLVGK